MFDPARPHKTGANVQVHDEQNPAPIARSSATETLAEAADPLSFPSLAPQRGAACRTRLRFARIGGKEFGLRYGGVAVLAHQRARSLPCYSQAGEPDVSNHSAPHSPQ